MEAIADSAAFAWPLAFSFACLALAGRAREVRRRSALNRALHELRRPLQTLALCSGGSRRGQLEQAIEALRDLDRKINGADEGERRRLIEAGSLAREAVERWREPVMRHGRSIELDWSSGPCEVRCEPGAIARALDNLIANALEHGSGTIRLEGTRRPGRLRFHVSDEGSAQELDPDALRRHRFGADPRRGHGSAIVAEVAAGHGGRFAACTYLGGVRAVIELPIAR